MIPVQGMGSGPKPPLLRTMMFIDGGYFEHWIENIWLTIFDQKSL